MYKIKTYVDFICVAFRSANQNSNNNIEQTK